jgi:hypothetical protein
MALVPLGVDGQEHKAVVVVQRATPSICRFPTGQHLAS